MIKNIFRTESRIGLLIDERKPYGRGVLVGVSQFSKAHPWTLFHVEEPSDHGLVELMRWNPIGLIVMVNEREMEQKIQSLQIPFVNVCSASGSDSLRVQTDNEMVGQIAAEHLLQPEVATFGYVGLEVEGTFVMERGSAYKKAINKAGHSCEIFLGSRFQLEYWLLRQPKPLALMTCNDTVGSQVLELCRGLKLNVPEDVTIVGVDNNETLSELIRPGLTSIALDTEGIGSRAADLLARAIKGEVQESRILLPPKAMVTRGSTRQPTGNDPLLRKMLADIQEIATGPHPLQDLLSAAPVSRMTIERKFRQLVGRTPTQEIRRVRINHAKELLCNTDSPLKSIADECGFSTPSRLIEAFLKETGMSPTDYRKKNSGDVHSRMTVRLP